MWTAEPVDVGLFASMERYGDLGVHAIIDLRRSFSRDELLRAAGATVADFPVLDCVYESRFFRDRWAPSSGPLSDAVHVSEPGDLESTTRAWTRRHIDPSRERPFRLVLVPKERGCRIILSLSHLAVDGAGMAAVGHVLGAHLYGVPAALPVERRRDLGRALDGLSFYHLPVLLRDTLSGFLQALRVSAAAKREKPYPSGGAGEPTSRDVVFEPAEVQAIRSRCGPKASVNDVLIVAVARVVAGRSSRGPMAVLYTMDLRRFARSPHLSAANASSILSVVLPREAARDLATAARVVGEITARQRRSLLGPAFLLLPTVLAGQTPHALLRWIMPALHVLLVDVPLARGLIFTNVGTLDRGLGPFAADIEALRVVGPNLHGVAVPAIVAFGLRGRLHLELFGPPGLAEEALIELERELREALEILPRDVT